MKGENNPPFEFLSLHLEAQTVGGSRMLVNLTGIGTCEGLPSEAKCYRRSNGYHTRYKEWVVEYVLTDTR